MTLGTLASMAGIGPSAMSQIEKGQIRPGIQVAKAIILALPFGLREIARMRDCWSAPERATVKLWDGIWDGLEA